MSAWLRGVDLNHRPLGYEPNELPDCSTPRIHTTNLIWQRQTSRKLSSAGARSRPSGGARRRLQHAEFARADVGKIGVGDHCLEQLAFLKALTGGAILPGVHPAESVGGGVGEPSGSR